MLDVDLVRPRPSVQAEFRISLVENLLFTMHVFAATPLHEGFDQWMYATSAAMPADLRADMSVALFLLAKSAALEVWAAQLPPEDPGRRDFSAFLARLDRLTEDDFERFVRVGLEIRAKYYEEEEALRALGPSLDDTAGLRALLHRLELDESYLDQAVRLVRNPAELRTLFVSVVTRFWQGFYGQEYERLLPVMERSVEYHRRQNYSGDLSTIFTAVTGRLMPEEWGSFDDVQKVVFIPSCHIGPYVSIYDQEELRPSLALIYNCRPTGAPEGGRPPSVQDIFPPLKALADETRLQILSILDGEELYAQQIVERLDISQPAVSRHLKLMLAGGVLSVRKEDAMKHFSVNEETLATLADRLRRFRGKPG